MARYFCRHGTESPDLATAKACTGDGCVQGPAPLRKTTTPRVQPVRTVIHVNEPPTPKQIWKVGDLGGDKTYAAKLTRGECSRYIDQLVRDKSHIEATPCLEDVVTPPEPPERLDLARAAGEVA